jgi:C1q domain
MKRTVMVCLAAAVASAVFAVAAIDGRAVAAPTGNIPFRANKTVDQAYAASIGPYGVISFESEPFDKGAAFTPATGTFVAPTAGTYAFGSHILVNGGAGTYELLLTVNGVINGTMEEWLDVIAAKPDGGVQALGGSTVRNLKAGDKVQLLFYSNGSGAKVLGRANASAIRPGYSIFFGQRTG